MAKFDDDALGSDEEFEQGLKKKSKLPWILAVAVVAAGIIGFVLYYYSTGAVQNRLISNLQKCKVAASGPSGKAPPISGDCMGYITAMAEHLPAACPKVLAAIKKTKDSTQQNLLLYALLTDRGRDFRGKKLGPKILEGQQCLEDALVHVHETQRSKHGTPGDGIEGLAWYNHALLDELHSWIIRVRVFSRVSTQSAINILDRLQIHTANLGKLMPTQRKKLKEILRKATFPKLAAIHKYLVDRILAAPSGGKSPYKFPEWLDDTIGDQVDPDSPLAEELLKTYFERLPYGTKGHGELVTWHKTLFRRHLLDRLEWERAMADGLEKTGRKHFGVLLKFLEANPLLPLRTGGKLPGWYTRALKMLSTQAEPSHPLVRHLFTALMNIAAKRLPDAPVQRLILLNGMYFPYSVQKWLANEWRDGAQAGELARAALISALVLGLGKHKDFDWLRNEQDFPEYSWLLKTLQPGSCAKSCPNPAALRRAEKANLAKQKGSLHKELAPLNKQLADTRANYRAFAQIPVAYYPLKKRLALVEAGLKAPEPSVRAFAVLGLSYALQSKADCNRAAKRLVPLAKDPSWLVRLLVFYRLWLLEQPAEKLTGFLTDPTPQIVQGWRKLMAGWKTPKVVALLARKDRAAGVALGVLAKRVGQGYTPDWKTLGALVRHPDPWTRIQLVLNFGSSGKLDFGPLLTAQELTVRAVAVDFLRRHASTAGAKKQIPAIVKLLGDPQLGVKVLAAQALAALQAKSALPVLKKLQSHPACPVRDKANAAVAALGGGKHKPLKCAYELFGL